MAGFPLASDVKFSVGFVSGWESQIGTGRIQTDAAINSGNSGGPIINAKTCKISAIADSKLAAVGVENTSFGVPIEYYKQMKPLMIRHCVFLLVIRKKIIPTILHIKHIKERGAAYQAYQGAWSGWLKELASNIHLISVTLDTFQLLSGWLKELAPANI